MKKEKAEMGRIILSVYTGCPILNDRPEYLGNEIRYEFRSFGNLFDFEEDIVLSKRVFWTFEGHYHFFKWNYNFLNTIVARKMTSKTTCDKSHFKVIQDYITSLFLGLSVIFKLTSSHVHT